MAPTPDEWGVAETLNNDNEQFAKYHQFGVDILKKSLELYGDGKWGGDWKLSSEDKDTGDKVFVRKTNEFGNVYALEGTIEADYERVFRVNWNDVTEMPQWNPSVKEFRVVAELGSQSQLVNNCSEAILGGLVSSRDFVDVRIWRKIDDAYCLAARSVEYEQVPPQKGKVRAQNKIGLFRISPGADGNSSKVIWMVSLDLKGMLLKSVVERAMNSFLIDYVRHLRKFVEKSEGVME